MIYRGIVTNVLDPEGKGRVRMRIPAVLGPAESGWASPMFAGGVAEVGDQVFATFESGDEDRILYVLETGGGSSSYSTNLDGGVPGSVYTPAQFIDGGGV